MGGQEENGRMALRSDVLVSEVLSKCEVLRRAGFWPSEQTLKSRAWLNNFDDCDKPLAAVLLDRFTFYSKRLTDSLLIASYNSLGDGLSKGPIVNSGDELIEALKSAVFTPVTGEIPNPTDSGYAFCRLARQILCVPEDNVVSTDKAILHARLGKTVVFLDDFIGTGDQFLSTWCRKYNIRGGEFVSFSDAYSISNFTAIYITLVSTDFGVRNIHNALPNVAICSAHILEQKSTVFGLDKIAFSQNEIDIFLKKYSARLCPAEEYISSNPRYLIYGYQERGLMFAFEHSVPDATLPIFWSPGIDGWQPLIERR